MANELSQQTHPVVALKKYLNNEDIQNRLKEMLGERASSFSNSIINVVSSNSHLQKAEAASIVKAALVSASLQLPIDPALGFAAIVPYGDQAQFQLMYRGVIQLCIRSGQYENIYDTEVYRDELESYNPITGEVRFRSLTEYKMRPQKNFNDVVGFYCHFKLLKGFRASLYMTKEEVMAHAERYSRAYQYDLKYKKQTCPWSTDPIAMGRKTVILQLLKRYGIMSIDMQDAVIAEAEDESFRHQVESTTIEPTAGRQKFGFTQPTSDQLAAGEPGNQTPPAEERTDGLKPCWRCGGMVDKRVRRNNHNVCYTCSQLSDDQFDRIPNQKAPTDQPAQEQEDVTERHDGTTDGTDITEPTDQAPAPPVEGTKKGNPNDLLKCRNNHTVMRSSIEATQLARGNQIGYCPACKAEGKLIFVEELKKP